MTARLELVTEFDHTTAHGDGPPPSSDDALVDALERIELALGRVRVGVLLLAAVAGALLIRLIA